MAHLFVCGISSHVATVMSLEIATLKLQNDGMLTE